MPLTQNLGQAVDVVVWYETYDHVGTVIMSAHDASKELLVVLT